MKKTYIVFASALMMLICLVYEGSYAYFAATVSTDANQHKSSVTAEDIKDITLTGGTNVNNTNMLPGDSVTSTFSVNNPNKEKVCFSLTWDNITNTFVNKSDLVVSVTDESNNTIVSNKVFGTTGSELLTTNINANTTKTYKMTITYLNTDDDQSDDMLKSFSGTLVGVLKECPAS